ncbi:MAG: hypothetical protein M1500_00665 [Candidatus Marsarchaeota archaeon]|nr:hypothetical protein [Candidatus Marsarchaeota archaeon]MCL5112215.1 hypothetical protein [Candidatus Marsarchaeota archaeon]
MDYTPDQSGSINVPQQGMAAPPQAKANSHAKVIVSAVVIVAVILGIIAYITLHGLSSAPPTTTITSQTTSAPTTATTSSVTTSATTTIIPINASTMAVVSNIVNSNALVQQLPNSNSLTLYYTNDSLGIFTQNLTAKYNLTNSTNLYYIFDREYGLPFTANYIASNNVTPINQTIPIPGEYANYTYPVMFIVHAAALQSPQAAKAAALYHTYCGCLGPTEKVTMVESNSTFTLYLANATVNGMQYYGAFFAYKDFYSSMITFGVRGKMNATYSIGLAKYYYSLLKK